MAAADQPHKDERTEDATPDKIRKERNKGNVFSSVDMATFIVIFLGAWVIFFFASWTFEHIYTLFTVSFSYATWLRVDEGNMQNFILGVLISVAKFLGPILLSMMAVGSFSYLIQTGWVVSWEKAEWKFSKIWEINWKSLNPFDGKKTVDFGLNMLKVTLIGLVLYQTYVANIQKFLPYLDQDVIQVWFFLFKVLFLVVMKISMVMFLLALLDYIYKKKKWDDDMKMTKQQVRQEAKDKHGDPKIKALVKKRRMDLYKKIMLEAVPQADVIITNPTHFSIALSYKKEDMEAPKVVAKGTDKLALKIREIAKSHQIPIVENKPLAQVLYKSVEVGEYIPMDLYQAVAEVMAYVYRLKQGNAA